MEAAWTTIWVGAQASAAGFLEDLVPMLGPISGLALLSLVLGLVFGVTRSAKG